MTSKKKMVVWGVRKKAFIGGTLALIFAIIVIWLTFSRKGVARLSPSPSPIAVKGTEVVEETANKLEIEDLTVGTGAEATPGGSLTVNYSGKLPDGTEFDSSYKRGKPFGFKLGAGQVIKGWDMGLVGMKVGGKRKLTIPPEYAYGSARIGSIPANATLVFEVELLDVK